MKTKSLGLTLLSGIILLFVAMYIFETGQSFTLPSMNVFDFELPTERWGESDNEPLLNDNDNDNEPLRNDSDSDNDNDGGELLFTENVINVVSPESGTIVGSPVTIDGTLNQPEDVHYTITDMRSGDVIGQGSFKAGTEWSRVILWDTQEGSFIFEFETQTTSTQIIVTSTN